MFKQYNIADECVYLVARGHFRSRDKDGDHITSKPHAARKLRGFTEPVLGTAHRSFTNVAGIGNSACFCELNRYPLKVYPQTKNELNFLRLSKVIILQRDMQKNGRYTDATKH